MLWRKSRAGGIPALARTRLTDLDLAPVGMGDRGVAALASVARSGRFNRLDAIYLDDNREVTDEGLCVLARAVEDAGQQGLPALSHISATGLKPVTGMGEGALAHALLKNCRRLKGFYLDNRNSDGVMDNVMVEGMVRAADARHKSKFRV